MNSINASARRSAAPFSCVFALMLGVAPAPIKAQEYSLYLKCEGALDTPKRKVPAFTDFALRFTGQRALIQRSNVLPVGRILNYDVTPAAYSMVLQLAPVGTRVVGVPGWLSNTVLVFQPNLNRMNQIRIGIDRVSGKLTGEVLNEQDEQLTSFAMDCRAVTEEETSNKKF